MNAKSPCTHCLHAPTRREWIRRLAMSCSAVTAGLAGLGGAPAARAAITNFKEVLRLDINAFPSLALNSGSAMISFNDGVSAVLINRESDLDFHAMDPTCPHMGCRVDTYSIATNTITCPCHGSQFNMSGQVVGRPAVTSLNTYTTQFDGVSALSIEVPGFVHRIDSIATHSSTPTSKRMKLTFLTMAGSQYQVRHSADLAGPFQTTAFATSAAGVANQTTLNGTGASATVYVDVEGGAGFFTLDLVIQQLAP